MAVEQAHRGKKQSKKRKSKENTSPSTDGEARNEPVFETKDPDFMSTVAAFCESAMQRAERNQQLKEKEQQLMADNLLR